MLMFSLSSCLTRNQIIKSRSPALYTCVVTALIALSLLFLNARHNLRYTWRPVQIPFHVKSGEAINTTFVAEIDGSYEIELEFQRRVPDEVIERIVEPLDEPSPIDISWSVSTDADVVARGDCRDYLYISSGGRSSSSLKRLGWVLFSIPRAQSAAGDFPTAIRGVGKVDCKAGLTYQVTVRINTTTDALLPTNPVFGVRVNRQFSRNHIRKMIPAVIAALGAAQLSVASFFWWIVSFIVAKNARLIPLAGGGIFVIIVSTFYIVQRTYSIVY